MITIVVERAAREFHAHRDLLCSASSYFKGGLQGGCSEASSKVVVLEEEKPEVFETFIYWMYFDRLAEPTRLKLGTFDATPTSVRLTEMELAQVWGFGVRRDVTGPQNARLKNLDLRHSETQSSDYYRITDAASDSTPPKATLRRYLADAAALLIKQAELG